MTKHTPLHQAHLDSGAKMGAFAGYDMPLYYGEGVMAEHEWVRAHAGIFDVSHMGQVMISGAKAQDYLERLTPSNYGTMPDGRAKYSVFTNERGGIIDDLIITRLAADQFFAVLNAGCKDKDIKWMRQNLTEGVTLDVMDDRALIALQGRESEAVMADLFGLELADIPYMWLIETELPGGIPAYVSRLGYTGEDGFEISIPQDHADTIWNRLLSHKEVKPIGLAARDSLRLEMGYCLYGHELDEDINPIEAGLSWVMGKDNTDFIGAAHILPLKENGAKRMRVGVRLIDKGVAREGAEILDADTQEVIGVLTSGSFAPSLKQSIGQAYIRTDKAQNGTKILVNVRGRHIAAEIAAMPFIPVKTRSPRREAA